MYTKVYLDDSVSPKTLEGIVPLAKAVGATMGPRGRSAIIRKQGRTFVTRDGVTVASAFKLKDEGAQAGADKLRTAAQEVDALNGDGTTTVTVLTAAILEQAQPLIESGTNPMLLKKSIDEAVEKVVSYIKEKAVPIASEKELAEVAAVAASDSEIGTLVAEVVWQLGSDALVTLKGGQSTRTQLEMVTGVQLASGLASPYLVRDQAAQQTALDDPHVVLCDRVLRDKDEIIPILRAITLLEGEPAIIIAHEITGDALGILVRNSVEQKVNAVGVGVSPNIFDKTTYLQDIASITGATVIGKDNGVVLDEVKPEMFGKTQSAVAGIDKTVLVRGYGDDAVVEERRKSALALSKDPSKQTPDLIARLSTLQGRVAIITIGGNSQAEIEERHYRFEDSIGAAKTAMRGGRVPGAGTTLFGASDTIGTTDGETVLANALKYPTMQILQNAGIDAQDIFTKLAYDRAPDVTKDDEVIDLFKNGIVDPAESNISSVQVAASTATLLMTAGSLIVDTEEQNDKTKQ